MCDGSHNFTLKMCHIVYTRFRVGARSRTWVLPVGKQLSPAATYYNVVDIKFERQGPPGFPHSGFVHAGHADNELSHAQLGPVL